MFKLLYCNCMNLMVLQGVRVPRRPSELSQTWSSEAGCGAREADPRVRRRPYAQSSVVNQPCHKLAYKFFWSI
jgi:hypothetical protein